MPRSKSVLTAAVDLAELVIGPIVCKPYHYIMLPLGWRPITILPLIAKTSNNRIMKDDKIISDTNSDI